MSYQAVGSSRVQNGSGPTFRSNVRGENEGNSGSSSDSETDSESDISEGRGTREHSLEPEMSYRSLDVEKMMGAMLCSNCELIVIPSKESVFCESGHYLCRSCQKQAGGKDCPVTDPGGVKCNKDGNRSALSCGAFPLYNAIFMAADFRCKYASLGCKTIVTSVTMKNHHNECDFRPNEDCIFSDCGKYLSTAFNDHYYAHRVKTFSQNSLWIKVLYDRPEKISLNEKLRWVSCILECFNNTFFLTVERHGGMWMVWMYALDDNENLDKFEVQLKLRSKDSKESSLSNSAVLDIHSRSLTSDKIRASRKYWKLSAVEMLPNLYPYGQGSTGTNLRYLIFNVVILKKSKADEKTEPEKGAAPTMVEIIHVPVLETLVEVEIKEDNITSSEEMAEPDTTIYVAERELEGEDRLQTLNGDEILENEISMPADENQEMNDAKPDSGDGDADAACLVPVTVQNVQENVSSARTDNESISSIIAQFLLPAVGKTETEVDSCTELAPICSQHQPIEIENTDGESRVIVVTETHAIKVDDEETATEEEEDEIFEDSISDENVVNLLRNDELPEPAASPQASDEGKYSWKGIISGISGGLKVLKAWIPVPIESGDPSTPVNPEESQG